MTLWLALTLPCGVRAASPFVVTASLDRVSEPPAVVVSATIPAGHHLYSDAWEVKVAGLALKPQSPLPVARVLDSFSGEQRDVLSRSFTVRYPLPADLAGAGSVEVAWQGCSSTVCFLPQSATFQLTADSGPAAAGATVSDRAPHRWLDGVRPTGTASGYLDARAFMAFLDRAEEAGTGAAQVGPHASRMAAFAADPSAFLRQRGWLLTALLVLLGGLMLNLTPCVLPMIPVNLAIIGAGVQNGSRARGLAMGSAYGAGMALAYGGLGVAVMLTGGFFGAVQSSAWFNLAIAAVFVVLGLALFDLLTIDLSRFQRNGPTGGGFVAALSMGAIAALLAGACVAPVVMAVLLLAGQLYHAGTRAALLLPLLLGADMALP
ncbi:MAG: cytochrome c biogenesis protein CcdA, partial [Kiritimatiellae bacterium]|nr:cytochrome c biogenesis protein CcdA [Kiritimatiellia bacterium]